MTNSVSRTNQQEKASRIMFFQKRTERLVTAVHMISETVENNSPIKEEMQKKSIELLSYTFSQNPAMDTSFDPYDFSKKYANKMLFLLSLVEIGRVTGLISEMNYRLVSQEMESLVGYSQDLSGVLTIDILKPSGERYLMKDEQSLKDKNHFKRIFEGATAILQTREDISKRHFKGHQSVTNKNLSYSNKIQDNQRTKENIRPLNNVHGRKSSRKEMIMNLIKDKDGLTIKDFSTVIKDCSEKTIQRELSSLVNSGLLRKEGDRRWSKYYKK